MKAWKNNIVIQMLGVLKRDKKYFINIFSLLQAFIGTLMCDSDLLSLDWLSELWEALADWGGYYLSKQETRWTEGHLLRHDIKNLLWDVFFGSAGFAFPGCLRNSLSGGFLLPLSPKLPSKKSYRWVPISQTSSISDSIVFSRSNLRWVVLLKLKNCSRLFSTKKYLMLPLNAERYLTASLWFNSLKGSPLTDNKLKYFVVRFFKYFQDFF